MWFNLLKSVRRFALSKNHKIEKRTYELKPVSNKPRSISGGQTGLWYSFTLGAGGWLSRTLYDYGWIDKYNYILELDVSNVKILKINGEKQLQDFDDKYGVKTKEWGNEIRWVKNPTKPEEPAVTEDYDGIEIRNVHYNWHKLGWPDSWDIDSGCIWNVNNVKVKKVKEVEERHRKKSERIKREKRELYEDD
jgi:hypothetical protein|tara:strand:+ start:3533 stop:4108 length:576 start_codon:yes stop_codon:yes gene_type:complete